jgi:hypothetical protein
MSEDASWDPNWWRAEKAMSLERKARKAALSVLGKPGDAFPIVTEGTVTEPVYFDLLLRDLQLSVVRIEVQPGDASDPRHVIRTAEREAKEQRRKARKGTLGINQPSKFDRVWAVVDTDVAVRMGFGNDVHQLANARKVTLAHSTPCFEFWLLLHVVGLTTRGDLQTALPPNQPSRKRWGESIPRTGTRPRKPLLHLLRTGPQPWVMPGRCVGIT